MIYQQMRVIVAGSRTITDCNWIYEELDKYKNHMSVILSGHANGVDKIGEKYAKDNGIKLEVYPADWKRYGRSAGYIRNAEIVQKADGLIAFWDGESKGTEHVIKEALGNDIFVIVNTWKRRK